MPIVRETQTAPIGTLQSAQGSIEPSFADTLSAAYEFNPYVSALRSEAGIENVLQNPQSRRREADFNPMSFSDQFSQEYWDDLVKAENIGEVCALKADIERKTQASKVLNASGVNGLIAGFLSGVADPLVAIPGGAIVSSAKSGVSVLKTGMAVAASSAAMQGVSDAMLSASDPTLDAEQFTTNLASAALVGGALGGALGTFAKLKTKGAVQGNYDAITEESKMSGQGSLLDVEVKSLSAASNPLAIKNVLKEAGGKVVATNSAFNTVFRALPDITPANYIINKAQSPEASGLMKMLSPYALQTEGAPVAQTLQGLNQMSQNIGLQTLREVNKIAKEAAKTEKTFSFSKFNEDVGLAARLKAHNAYDDMGTSYGRAVGKAADRLLDYYQKSAAEIDAVGLSVRDQYAGPSLVAPEKIDANFVSLLERRFSQAIEDAKIRLASFTQDTKNIKKAEAEYKKLFGKSYADDVAVSSKSLDDIKADALAFSNRLKSGVYFGAMDDYALAMDDNILSKYYSRSLFVDKWEVEFAKYFKNDVNQQVNYYSRRVMNNVNERKLFGPDGYKGAIKTVEDFYDNLAATVDDGGLSVKERERVVSGLNSAYESIAGIRGARSAAFLGPKAQKAIESVKAWNAVSRLTLSAASNFVELFGSIHTHGMDNFLGSVNKVFFDKASKLIGGLSRSDAEILADATDLARNDLLHGFIGFDELSKADSASEVILSKASRAVYTPLAAINDTAKKIAMYQTSARWDKIARKSNLTKSDVQYLDRIGLTHDDVKRIAALDDVSQWTAKDTNAFYNSVSGNVLEADPTLLPASLNNPVGSLLFQFKSWMLAANQKLLLRGLQQADASVLQSMFTLTAISALGIMARRVVTGQPALKEGEETQDIIYNAFSNSGLLGMPGFLVDSFALYRVLGVDLDRSRYMTDSAAGMVFGPTINTLAGFASAAEVGIDALTDEEIQRKDIRKAISTAPFISPWATPITDVVKPKE